MIEVMGFIDEGDLDLISEGPTHQSGSGSRWSAEEDRPREFFRIVGHSKFRLMVWAGTVLFGPVNTQGR